MKRNKAGQREKTRGWLIIGSILTLLFVTVVGWILMHHPDDWRWYIGEIAGEQGQVKDIVGEQVRAGETAGESGSTRDFRREPWQWLDWLAASFVGVLIYILAQAAYWHQKEDSDFITYTPWYISTAVKAPVVAFAIMLFLNNVSAEVSGLSINFSELEPAGLLAIAFVLGFYGRVAREQLNQLVKALFGKAYSTAEEEFTIEPATAQVVFGRSVLFATLPYSQVTWLASAGQIVDGLYTAPANGDGVKHGQVVQITAVPKDPNVPSAVARVTLVLFEIVGSAKAAYDTTEGFQVVPKHDVTWSVTPAINGAKIDGNGNYRTPTREAAESAGLDKVTIGAASRGEEQAVATLEVDFYGGN
jgi:hypothetical protein